MPGKVPKILIVDDEPDLRELMEDRFQIFSYDTASASNGTEALKYVQNNTVDVVLSDIRMAGGDGITLLKALKASDVFTPHVFLMTGFHEDFKERDMFNLGADGFFPKPFDAALIRNMIQRVLVSNEMRWSIKDRFHATKQIRLSIGDHLQAEKEHRFQPGRLGFSLVVPGKDFKTSDVVEFDVATDLNLKGLGRVVWDYEYAAGRQALGLEILYLEAQSLKDYVAMVTAEKPVASIPLP